MPPEEASKPTAGEPFAPDPEVPDNSAAIMDVFGLEGDWAAGKTGAEANLSGQSADGGAPAESAPAAEGGEVAPVPASPAAAQPAAQPPQPDVGASQQPQPGQPAAQPAASPAAPAPTPPASAAGSELETLKAQVQALQQLLQAQSSVQPGGAQPSTSSPGGATQPSEMPTPEQLMDYRLGIHDTVLDALNSEDAGVRANGLHHLVNNLGKAVHSRVIAHVDQLVAAKLQNYGHEQQQTQQQAEMQRDYYTAFPDHGEPLTRLVVAQEANVMWQADPTLVWNEATRNALGERVNIKLGRAAIPQVPAEPAAQPNGNGAAPPAKPAAQMGATNRAGDQGKPDAGQEMVDILGAFI